MQLERRIRALEQTMNDAFGRWLKGLTDQQLNALRVDSDFDLGSVSDADLERLAAGEAPEVVLGSDYATKYKKRTELSGV